MTDGISTYIGPVIARARGRVLSAGFSLAYAGDSTSSVWTPADLFASGEDGAWYDPSDLSTMYTDDGVTNVTADGDVVYRVDDKSGNGRHYRQATAAKRPLYKTDGTLHWLQFDGTDDTLETVVGASMPQPNTGFFGIDATSTGAGRVIVNGIDGAANRQQLSTVDITGTIYFAMYAGSQINSSYDIASGVAVLSCIYNGATSEMRANGASVGTGDVGAMNPRGFRLGAYDATGTNGLNGKVYGMISVAGTPSVTDPESYMAGKSGVTL